MKYPLLSVRLLLIHEVRFVTSYPSKTWGKAFMASKPRFSCPILINKLEEQFGANQSKEDLPLRESQDVPEFIKAKEKSEREAHSTKIVFK